MSRALHRVTCKAAFYDPSHKDVLIVEYNKDNFGLPGGHLEDGEDPDSAITRELYEELKISIDRPLSHKDFWIHDNGKVILGFVGELDKSTSFDVDQSEMSAAKWVSVDDIKTGKISTGSYDKFIIDNCIK